MAFEFELTDNSGDVLSALGIDVEKGLTAVGMQAANYSKLELENNPRRRDSGRLINSITYKVDKGEQSVTIGTNVEYGIYVHEGTGIYAPSGGTGGWWVYVLNGNGSMKGHASGKRYTEAEARRIVAILHEKGLDAHMTQGMKPNRFLKNGVANHAQEYAEIFKQYLQS